MRASTPCHEGTDALFHYLGKIIEEIKIPGPQAHHCGPKETRYVCRSTPTAYTKIQCGLHAPTYFQERKAVWIFHSSAPMNEVLSVDSAVPAAFSH